MCIIESMRKTPTGITTGDVVAFIISPALLMAKLTAEGCEIAARERKARVRVPQGTDGLSWLLFAGGVVMATLHICGVV
jgi:hypothetical protein